MFRFAPNLLQMFGSNSKGDVTLVAVQTMRTHARRSLAMQLRSKMHPATAR
jgi:hypothetical protein